MPTCREVSIALQSQYDALTIPETSLPSARVSSCSSSSQAEVSIPTYPSSQFWLSYSCPSPSTASGCRLYYFKLFMNGRHVVSWGVGEEDNWSGKTMFGLFGGGTDFEGRKVVEKRAFFFASNGKSKQTDGGLLEIRVYRSKARRREKTGSAILEGPAFRGDAVSISSVGRLKKGEPRRHYTYALIDSIDEPYCTFRYHLEPSTTARSSPISIKSPPDRKPSDADSSAREASVERRLSVPPRMKLRPSTTKYEPSSPIKQSDTSPTGATPVQECAEVEGVNGNGNPCEEFVVRTPSPQRFEQARTPPSSGRSKNGSINLLRGVIANALKRRDESRSGGSV